MTIIRIHQLTKDESGFRKSMRKMKKKEFKEYLKKEEYLNNLTKKAIKEGIYWDKWWSQIREASALLGLQKHEMRWKMP